MLLRWRKDNLKMKGERMLSKVDWTKSIGTESHIGRSEVSRLWVGVVSTS